MRHDSLPPQPARRERPIRPVAGDAFDRLHAKHIPWYEDTETVRRGLKWGRKKARLLAWVRAQMFLRLTPVERRCIELYYLRGLNYREAGAVLGVHASSVYRGVRRGIRKLREAAGEHPELKL